jgi:DNA modification methylase
MSEKSALEKLDLCNFTFVETTLDQVDEGERFRKDYGDIESLAQNITKEGLIQPVSVMISTEGSEKPYTLVAGGRRFQALQFIDKRKKANNLGPLMVTLRVYNCLTDHQLRVLEYSENIYRKDLTWQEKIKLESKIHELQVKEHGVKHSTAINAPGWSQKDTAELMGKSVGKISEDLKLAKMMDTLPEVDWNKFKTQNDVKKALKGAEKAVEQTVNARKAAAVLKTGEDRKRVLVNAYHVEDFFEGVKKIDNHSIDLCEVDPPYAIDLEKKKKGYNYTGYNEIEPEKYEAFIRRTFQECYRVLKDNSWMIVWFGPDPWFEPIHQWIEDAGFSASRIVGIWAKGENNQDGIIEAVQGQTMAPEYVLANGYEMFFWAKKGSPTIKKGGRTNVYGYKPVPHSHKYHPTERPKELINEILRTFATINDKILVPFAGSGRTLLEAAKLSMIPVGFDLTKEYRDGYIIRIHKEI